MAARCAGTALCFRGWKSAGANGLQAPVRLAYGIKYLIGTESPDRRQADYISAGMAFACRFEASLKCREGLTRAGSIPIKN